MVYFQDLGRAVRVSRSGTAQLLCRLSSRGISTIFHVPSVVRGFIISLSLSLSLSLTGQLVAVEKEQGDAFEASELTRDSTCAPLTPR